ncbi:hypothetical protein A0O28_0047980 [Trichoderma guizhouense]|uniref:Enoyl reductase (ER) domain-containing protein n=1 Tax=Trichoderma guizhouense TaxID=1491466 RepID=A0A1T3CD92_9HYPO|nr:hypothetical protein A0O28_0047980 [Trichoderma guizhouense]
MHDLKSIPTKAYVVESKGAPFVLQDILLDEIQSHEVLVEILYTGLCHTDIVVQHGGMPVGGYPAILGHEGVGVVRKIGLSVSNRIVGMGAVGFAALMAARALGVAQIIAVDIVDEKLQIATSLGATHTINSSAFQDINEGLRSIFPDGVDMIIEATGIAILAEASVKALAHGGTLALVGALPPEADLKINGLDVLTSCKKIVGVIEGSSNPHEMIPRLVELYKQGKFPVDKLSKVYPAEQLDQALEDLKTGKVIKPVLSWESVACSE